MFIVNVSLAKLYNLCQCDLPNLISLLYNVETANCGRLIERFILMCCGAYLKEPKRTILSEDRVTTCDIPLLRGAEFRVT
jgi:hypothetical protein